MLLLILSGQQAGASLALQSNWLGYQNNISANDTTTVSTANTTISGANGNNLTNLIKNGDFEYGFTSKGVFGGNLSYFTNNNASSPNYLAIPDWTGTGGGGATDNSTNWFASTYAMWGQTNDPHASNGNDINSATPHNTNAVYMGNYYATATGTPFFNTNGSVTGVTAITSNNFGVPAVISQTVTGLVVGKTYSFSFWASGEDAGSPGQYWTGGDGIFQLSVTGEASQFLAAPEGNSTYNSSVTAGFGPTHYYQYLFTPTNSTVTFSWTNWGHVGSNRSELVLDDVTLVALVPEVSNAGMALIVLLGLGVKFQRSRRPRSQRA